MVVPSSNEYTIDAPHLVTMRQIFCTPDGDTPGELFSYFEDVIAFMHHFNENTQVHEIKALLVSFERKAEHQFGFLFHQASKRICLPPDTYSHFALQFGKMIYGTLCVRKQSDQPDMPAFPLKLAHYLARLCGWLLYTCEQSMFIWSYQQPEFSNGNALTKREREVLTLMCHGYGLEDIAHALNITSATVTKHKQHIYNQLGVHNVRDALHVSYHCGLVSFLDELYEWRNN
jgi:DNA-binding CsgD family transcriptional regulator